MKIHCLSDTHNLHEEFKLPGGDLLIHAGDATGRGQLPEIIKFLEWYAIQPYEHKIFVPGNHDWGFELSEALCREECERRGIVLLINQEVEIEGVKIYGSPVSPRFFDWAFNVERGPDIKAFWDMIPDDTELLVTHSPPVKILDWVFRGGNVGCNDLFNRILELKKLKVHIFGHIHPSRGTQMFMDKLFINAASVSDRHLPCENAPYKLTRDEAGNYQLDE